MAWPNEEQVYQLKAGLLQQRTNRPATRPLQGLSYTRAHRLSSSPVAAEPANGLLPRKPRRHNMHGPSPSQSEGHQACTQPCPCTPWQPSFCAGSCFPRHQLLLPHARWTPPCICSVNKPAVASSPTSTCKEALATVHAPTDLSCHCHRPTDKLLQTNEQARCTPDQLSAYVLAQLPHAGLRSFPAAIKTNLYLSFLEPHPAPMTVPTRS